VRLLDLYSCEGGAAAGYAAVGFEVVGVDTNPRVAKRYPFEFHTADAIDYAKAHAHQYDVIHASPPCQHASAGTRYRDRTRYPALIEPTRDALAATGKPYVIENVAGSALLNPVLLCGTMFELTAVDDDGTLLHLQRHRLFESNMALTALEHTHPPGVQWAGSYGGARRDKHEARNIRHGGYVPSIAVQQQLLGIDWMTQYGMHQSLPPAYTAHIGWQLITALEAAA
jgi:DNA (cytosine-5)-methyltransferase 1